MNQDTPYCKFSSNPATNITELSELTGDEIKAMLWMDREMCYDIPLDSKTENSYLHKTINEQ